jgi:hypothetical protein
MPSADMRVSAALVFLDTVVGPARIGLLASEHLFG